MHSFIESKTAIAFFIIALFVVCLGIRKLTEDPERKTTKRMLNQLEQRGLTIIGMQLDGEGNPAHYEQANALLAQSREPARRAEAAFKQGRYATARFQAAGAFNYVNAGLALLNRSEADENVSNS
jgi:hypothetical protein